MDNLALEIIGEAEEGFAINNDNLAEWALKKIAEERAETQRMINVCQTFINEYQMKAENYSKQYESKTAYLKEQLRLYFESVPHKATKTQETYKLPSGTLKRKFGTPEFKVDNDILVKWLEDNEFGSYVKTEKKAQWGELKKTVTVRSDKIISVNGEIIDGVTAQERPDSFEVEI